MSTENHRKVQASMDIPVNLWEIYVLFIHNRFTKRRKGQFNQFQMLSSERNADDRYEENKCKYKMHDRGVKAACQYPDYVEKKREASAGWWSWNNFLAEGHELKQAYFKTLNAERDTYYCDAKDKACYKVTHCGKESSADQPDQVPEQVHCLKIKSFEYLHF